MTVERSRHLPDFGAPPVTEVAVSLQFQQISKFGVVDVGPLWEQFRDRFGRVEYHPPLAPTFETFGLPQGAMPPFLMNFGILPLVPRCWFVDQGGAEVLQFQTDRLIHNWRKAEVNSIYPRYEHIRARFADEMQCLQTFLDERDFGPLLPNQCELTYINVVRLPEGVADQTSEVFANWRAIPTPVLGNFEDVAFTCRFRILDQAGEPIGRIIAQASPGLDAEGLPIIQLTLVGRGGPAAPSLEAALDFFDIARERIVCGFAELTTTKMHEIWKRRS